MRNIIYFKFFYFCSYEEYVQKDFIDLIPYISLRLYLRISLFYITRLFGTVRPGMFWRNAVYSKLDRLTAYVRYV